MCHLSFEVGPIRPPSESESLLIRVTRNCPWNRCAFCHTYKGQRFELRTVQEIKRDIDTVKAIVDEIKTLSWSIGEGGHITNSVLRRVYTNEEKYGEPHRYVCFWLYSGGKTVFIQDADSPIIKTDDLAEILEYIRTSFPYVERITSYCRAKTASRKSTEEWKRLKSAGLSRIHIGMESGNDEVLNFINKGVTAREIIEGSRKIKEAGIELSEYVMPGLGGKTWSAAHAADTAKVLNAINPDFIRLRTLQIVKGTPLYEKFQKGEFEKLNEDETLLEIKDFLTRLEGITSWVVSDHILNLLEEIEGKLPGDKEKMIEVIDKYFDLSPEDRLVFRVGRRMGVWGKLSDINDKYIYQRIKNIIDSYSSGEPERLDRDLDYIKERYI
ncbi:MAG: radical SAM protein [Syntrophales bacterium]|nr:radical SAM protein [Syntrophales bacterium]